MESYLLDTNIWIEAFRGNPRIVAALDALAPENLTLSNIVLGELLVGAYKNPSSSELQKIYRLRDTYRNLAVSDRTAHEYASIRVALEAKGTPIGRNDLWIAAQALEHGLTLVTHNVTEFGRVPTLKVTDWSASVSGQ